MSCNLKHNIYISRPFKFTVCIHSITNMSYADSTQVHHSNAALILVKFIH